MSAFETNETVYIVSDIVMPRKAAITHVADGVATVRPVLGGREYLFDADTGREIGVLQFAMMIERPSPRLDRIIARANVHARRRELAGHARGLDQLSEKEAAVQLDLIELTVQRLRDAERALKDLR